jgi:hypothetical protein
MRLCEDSGLRDHCTFTSPSEGGSVHMGGFTHSRGFGHSIHS